MKNIKSVLVIAGIGSFLIIDGCLKDKITQPENISLNDSAKLLFYMEENGDYANSQDMPSLADVDEVYQSLGSYLLVDIRPAEQFTSGHISGAFNLSHSKLVVFLDSIDLPRYPKVIIISKNGQSSAYYTCLLRLYGFNSTYSMTYGMAAWNPAFSDEWLNACQQDAEQLSLYNDEIVPKPPFSQLPPVSLNGASLDAAAKERLREMMAVEYEDKPGSMESTATIEYLTLMDNGQDFFIVCYGSGLMYKNLTDGIRHPAGAVLYHPPEIFSDFQSTTYLQTLPSNRKIALYSVDGQLSAFAVAYLRVLGYNSKSVLFGANNMFYNILAHSDTISFMAFTQDKIRDYPFVTGN